VPVSEEEVRFCYRYLLGREAENQDIVARHATTAENFAALRQRFLNSAEFVAQFPSNRARVRLDVAPLEIETQVEEVALGQLLDHVARTWNELGETAPHYSVLTDPAYRPEEIARTRDAFYATGTQDLALVRACLARAGARAEALPLCLDYGCGVGRATSHLAGAFRRVIGCDISAAHLRLAEERLAELGVGNVELRRIGRGMLHPDVGVDLWFSRIVLQHNPPPVQLRIVELALARLNPGGYAIFQTLTHRDGYRFGLAGYLAGEPGAGMEMHVLPQRNIFATAAAAGCVPVEVRDDTPTVNPDTRHWLSHLFVFHRPA
jgi:SAM-dependent methyltransferase